MWEWCVKTGTKKLQTVEQWVYSVDLFKVRKHPHHLSLSLPPSLSLSLSTAPCLCLSAAVFFPFCFSRAPESSLQPSQPTQKLSGFYYCNFTDTCA